jgi:formylglycine-generating enzyme required for sulfatase activity
VSNPTPGRNFIHQVTVFAIVLAGGLALAMTRGNQRATASMIHLSRATTEMGIDKGEIAKFEKVFPVMIAQLFEEMIPRHSVRVRSFFIDKYLVTNSQFKQFVDRYPDWQPGKMPSHLDNGNYLKHWVPDSFAADKKNHPVVNVNWYAATAYCQAQGKRLPSEAEWEYAARGGLLSRLFPWGDEPATPKLANYSSGKLHTTSPVGSYPPNGYGIYDMAGSVWEFLADEWGKYPAGTAVPTSKDPSRTSFIEVRTRRVIRGGSFDGDPINLWVEHRDSHPPDGSQPFVGFRCAK